MNILLIENDSILNGTIAEYLKFKGNEIVSLESNGGAFNLIDKTNFDLYIIDIDMPQKNGMEFVKYIRKKDKDTPIIRITDLMEFGDINSAYKMDDYIRKPFYLEELEIKINRLTN